MGSTVEHDRYPSLKLVLEPDGLMTRQGVNKASCQVTVGNNGTGATFRSRSRSIASSKRTSVGRQGWQNKKRVGGSLTQASCSCHDGEWPGLLRRSSRMMSKGRTRQLASHDVSVAFFHAWLERGVWVKPPKDFRLSDDWLWYVVKALYGMRESSKAFQEVVREMYTTYEWTLLRTVPCLAYCGRLDSLAGWHGDDFCTEGEPGALDEVDEMILASFKAKVLPRLEPGASTEGTILSRFLRWSEEGVHMAPDAKHVENLAGLLQVRGAKPSPTPSSRAAAEATVFRRGTGIALYLGPVMLRCRCCDNRVVPTIVTY